MCVIYAKQSIKCSIIFEIFFILFLLRWFRFDIDFVLFIRGCWIVNLKSEFRFWNLYAYNCVFFSSLPHFLVGSVFLKFLSRFVRSFCFVLFLIYVIIRLFVLFSLSLSFSSLLHFVRFDFRKNERYCKISQSVVCFMFGVIVSRVFWCHQFGIVYFVCISQWYANNETEKYLYIDDDVRNGLKSIIAL